jgi:hypothetical protein
MPGDAPETKQEQPPTRPPGNGAVPDRRDEHGVDVDRRSRQVREGNQQPEPALRTRRAVRRVGECQNHDVPVRGLALG